MPIMENRIPSQLSEHDVEDLARWYRYPAGAPADVRELLHDPAIRAALRRALIEREVIA